MLSAASDTFRILAYPEFCFFSSTLCNPTYSQAYHILNHGIFRIGGIFKTMWNFDHAYSELCIVRAVYSGIIQPYSDIFGTLCSAYICRNLAYLEPCNIQNSSIIVSQRIFKTLSYLQKIGKPWKFRTWHIGKPGIFRTLTYLKPSIYSEPSQRFKMVVLQK